MPEHGSNPFDPAHLFGHVQDSDYLELPRMLTPDGTGKIVLPQPLERAEPIWSLHTGQEQLDVLVEPLDLKFTKFMLIEVAVAVILCVLFVGLATSLRRSGHVRGRLVALLETMVVFIRDQVARPAIGGHDADRFVPFLLTMFFFVLGCNLMGMLPWSGTPTASLATTGALAFITFCTVIVSGMRKLGAVGFWKALVPHIELPGVMAVFLVPMIFGLELAGLLIKHFVLSVRLLANMLAGHLVLATLMAFITLAWSSWAVLAGVMPASIFGAVALSLLELFVAFLQAYIFAFLSALFIGMAVHPH